MILEDSNHRALGLEFFELAERQLDPVAVDLVPGSYALKHQTLPLELDGEVLIVAIGAVGGLGAVDDLGVLIERPTRAVLADPALIRDRIEERFLEGMLSELPASEEAFEIAEEDDLADLQRLAGEAAVVQMVNVMFAQAVRDGVSDIHVEPYERSLKIRFRTDGILHDAMSPQRRMHAAIVSRIKILGEMNIAERRLPQDGRIKLTLAGRQIDVRVSIVPTVFGERAVMRILDKGETMFTLPQLGMRPATHEQFARIIQSPYGMILVTGPTGSGKSTTLYAALQEIYSPERNILTIEDPVEYQVSGIGQIQVRPAIGLTFANGLRSIVRQDPDVIMVGEIRDHETAEISIHAALTGHLVFSTLHTNDSAGAITRLLDMGVEPYLAASSIISVLAQRLVRRNDPKTVYESEEKLELLEAIGIEPDDYDSSNAPFRRSEPAESNRGTGFKGRRGIFELIVVDEAVRRMTVDRESASVIKRYAIEEQNMTTLLGDGRLAVLEGDTTPEEVLRVCQRDEF